MQFTVGVGRNAVATQPSAQQPDVVVAGTENKTAEIPTKTVSQSSDPDVQIMVRAWDLLGLRLEVLSEADKLDVTGRSYAGARGAVRYNGGLRVVAIKADSQASKFVKEGDILLGLDGFETLGPVNLSFILKQDRIQNSNALKCQIYRKGSNPLEGTLPLQR